MKCKKEAFERLMKQNFFNNATLAEAMGVNVMTVSKLRNGKTEPQAATLKKLCEALKCTPAELLDD
ncbi:MAG: helix-turn-helix transcriptional regulator [Enterococcus sp.]|nr:helix-turn-helix transcriptional regulator [Enterococcus sp.]